jgi:hypothetical protein
MKIMFYRVDHYKSNKDICVIISLMLGKEIGKLQSVPK